MIRLRDGNVLDVEAPVRGWQRYTSQDRADLNASFRLGPRQREATGEAFWTHPRMPGVCYPTRAECIRALLQSLATPEVPDAR